MTAPTRPAPQSSAQLTPAPVDGPPFFGEIAYPRRAATSPASTRRPTHTEVTG
ncbi:hypothetical protein AB0M43_32605 [Longispora sp. NPDC051575]|uniref:hypothetical protein n=1 Tax=Longispora sp. NPDC051575 TaxID=3154943 RepID=UPI003428CE05